MKKPQSNRKFTCWARSGGGCGEGPSREHLVSDCLFPEGVVHVSGFDWCAGETKSIGVNGLARQILCKTHNTALSETDSEAKKALLLFQRTSPPTPADPLGDNCVDGRKFERWLLKTALNITYGSNLHIGVGMWDSKPGIPTPYLIEVAFGRLSFSEQMGAHFLFPHRATQHYPSEIVVVPLVKDGHIGGFYFELRSQAVFLNLFPGHAPPTLGAVSSFSLGIQKELLEATLIYRPPIIATAANGRPVSTVKFDW